MGVMDAVDTSINGLLGGIIIGAVYTGLWATLIGYYGNSEIFLLGALVLTIAGIIPIVFFVALIKRIMNDTASERATINDFTDRFRGTE